VVCQHAVAAYDILVETLTPYADPDRSPRFSLVRVPLAQIVRFLIEAGDPAGQDAFGRFPTLALVFSDPQRGILHPDRGGFKSHEWIRVGEYDYVIY
jgi:hypothetical protein